VVFLVCVVAGADLRHWKCVFRCSISILPDQKRISLRIHHIGKSINPIDWPELSQITKSMLLPDVQIRKSPDQ
jgi:hypothetical protein